MIGKQSAICMALMLLAIFALWWHMDNSETQYPYINDDGMLVGDRRASFLDYNVSEYRFAARFFDIAASDIPNPETMLNFKNSTKISLFMNEKNVTVLPTVDYQAIYVFGHAGFAHVVIHMCPEGQYVFGGVIAKGWNIIALDFPKLLELGKCTNFSMKTGSPTLSFNGIGSFNVWKIDRFMKFEGFVPHKSSNTIRNLLIGWCFVFLCICENSKRRVATTTKISPNRASIEKYP